jgi:hypothetical protein
MSASLDPALAAAAALIATAFSLSALDRWLRRRQPHDGAWCTAMALFALGSFALWWGTAAGWNGPVFRTFFLAGAVLNVAWLSLGTVYLLAGRRIGDPVSRALALTSMFAAGVLIVTPLAGSIDPDDLPRGRDVFGVLPRILAATGSGVAALVIFVGAGWSVVRLLRGRSASLPTRGARSTLAPRRLVFANLLIAAGTVVLSLSGSLAGRLGDDRAFVVTLLAGVVVLFAGFLAAGGGQSRQRASHYLARAAEWH